MKRIYKGSKEFIKDQDRRIKRRRAHEAIERSRGDRKNETKKEEKEKKAKPKGMEREENPECSSNAKKTAKKT